MDDISQLLAGLGMAGNKDGLVNPMDYMYQSEDRARKLKMLEEQMQMKRESQASTMNHNSALAQQALAQAARTQQETLQMPADRQAAIEAKMFKTKQEEELRKRRGILGQLQGLQGISGMDVAQDGSNDLNSIIPGMELPPEIAGILHPAPGVRNYTTDALNKAIASLRETDPSLTKQNVMEGQQAGMDRRGEADRASRERIEAGKAASRKEHDALMREAKTPQNYESLAVQYEQKAQLAADPEQRQHYQILAHEARAKKGELNASIQEAKYADEMDKLYKMTGGKFGKPKLATPPPATSGKPKASAKDF